MAKTTLGVIVGNRGFFPDHFAKTGRAEILKVLKAEGLNSVCLKTAETAAHGAVETFADAEKCAELFKANAGKIDGVLVTLPNFGDEQAVANTVRLSGLDVPIMVHAWPDDPTSMKMGERRDSFCGKISVANNLLQYGYVFTLPRLHTVAPTSEIFLEDLRDFAATCRVVRRLKDLRVGMIGARTGPFATVRFSEKLLEEAGISVAVVDLSEIFGRCDRLKDSDAKVKRQLRKIKDYVDTSAAPADALVKMAKFGLVIDEWMDENSLQASAIQCWTAIEEFFGIVPCTVMSMLSDRLAPSACETDICGTLSMLVMAAASERPSALVDWNNNYGDDPDKCVLFHCSNLPKSVFADVKMDYQEIIAGSVGAENTWGTCVGRIAPGPFTFTRITTDDSRGVIAAYTGEGEFTDDPLATFGGYGVARIEGLQEVLRYACVAGFEHHVAINQSRVSGAVAEALSTYMEWDVYHHNPRD